MSNKVTTQLVIDGKNTASAAFKAADRQLFNLDSLAKKAGASIAAALSVGVVTAWVKRSIDAADAARKLAQGAGLTTKAFTGLEFAFSQSGLGRGEMAKSFSQLNRAMVQAAEGAGRPAEAFKALGVSVRNAEGAIRPADEVLNELADKFQTLPDGVEKSALAADLFGRNLGSKMIPLLNAGSQGIADLVAQAERLGLVISDEQAAKSEQFNDQLATLGKVSEGAGNTIAGELLPTLTEMSGLLVDVSEKGQAATVFARALGYGLKALAVAAVIAGAAIQTTGQTIAAVAAAAMAVAKRDFAEAAFYLKELAADNAETANTMVERIKMIATGGYEELGNQATNTRKVIEGANEGMAKSTDDYARSAQRSLRDLVSAEKAAQRDIERIRKERLRIEQRYSDAAAGLAGGAEPTVMAAMSLKAGARQALVAGDVAGAQAQAQAALKVMQDLAAAGKNTYGFAGFIKELRDIELAANDIEQTGAEEKIKALKAELDTLMKDIKVAPELDENARAKLLADAKDLADQLSKTLVIKPQVVMPKPGEADADGYVFVPNVQKPQGFATGGHVRGPGTGTSDSIPALLSNGEYVIRAAAVRKLGKGYLDLINNGIPLRRFADGGMVESVASMAVAPSLPNLGSLTLDIGGQSTTIYADQSAALDLKRLATKLGRTKR